MSNEYEFLKKQMEEMQAARKTREEAPFLAEIASLRSSLAAAERARDEAVRDRDEQARLRQIAEDAIPKGLAVGMEFIRAEATRERDEAVNDREALVAALTLLVEWGARGHNPNDLAPWIRATQTLKDARGRQVLDPMFQRARAGDEEKP